MAKQKIRIRLKAFDHKVLDSSAEKIRTPPVVRARGCRVQYRCPRSVMW